MRSSPVRWDREEVARFLLGSRDQLIRELPRRNRGAAGLSHDQIERVVDDAITFMTTEFQRPVEDTEELERAFWATAAHRVRRVHEGRGETVRAGWRRVDIDDTVLADDRETAEETVVREQERHVLLEFVAMLTDRERQIFACKYGLTAKPQGYKLIAQRLGLPVSEVRATERSIDHKLERFNVILAAGALCSYRGVAVEALATKEATEDQQRAARVHLKHCRSCRAVFRHRRRALRRGDFQREVAGLLPLPIAAVEERGGRGGGPVHALLDWVARPFAGDGGSTAAQLAASGAGRGLGTVATVKIASLCVSGLVASGGVYCAVTGNVPGHGNGERRPQTVRAEPGPAAPGPVRLSKRLTDPTSEAPPQRTARKPRKRPTRDRAPKPTSKTSVDTRQAEQPVVSSVPASASGNDFDFEQTGPSTSAPAAPAPVSGGGEFLP